MSDRLSYIDRQRELLNQINERINRGDETEFTFQLRREVTDKINSFEKSGYVVKNKPWFHSLTSNKFLCNEIVNPILSTHF